MRTTIIQSGRHRLGTAGTMHCIRIPAVAAALAAHRRSWFTALLSPARHSFAAMRSRGGITRWIPATAS